MDRQLFISPHRGWALNLNIALDKANGAFNTALHALHTGSKQEPSMSAILESALTPEQKAEADAADRAAEAAHAALLGALAARAMQPRPLGLFGTVAQHRMPCPSDADPGANDFSDDEAEMLTAIDEAESALAMARELIEGRQPAALLAARSRMNDAIGWLREEA
jgi:hypothetical protein